MQTTLGGDRLGSGNKQKVDLHNYERSTHDLSYLWRSTMASGTLVPFLTEVGLPGDSFDIDLNVDVKTHPTIGPLFGSYKVQLDVFTCPVRLYNGKLHMNLLNIGLNMSQIKLPQLLLTADGTKYRDNDQINPSCLLSYLNIRGLGKGTGTIERQFNAIPYLAYWDIYKNYYANKQEELGAFIHNEQLEETNLITDWEIHTPLTIYTVTNSPGSPEVIDLPNSTTYIIFDNEYTPDKTKVFWYGRPLLGYGEALEVANWPITSIYDVVEWYEDTKQLVCTHPKTEYLRFESQSYYYNGETYSDNAPRVRTFPLVNIDTMREDILTATLSAEPFVIDGGSNWPYGAVLDHGDNYVWCATGNQEGLGLKTYQSDLFNNWISTEWIDGENGINEITAVDTSGGNFTINALQLSNKVYEMLNRIAVSGGSYDDWLTAVYAHERTRATENPMYMGGLIRELAFQEVVSNASSISQDAEQPLGTLAGRGVLTSKNKGGKIKIRVDEPCYIIGIASLTPRIDYSQGNKWDTNLKTMDDFHKPGLDEIGFQDLITDQMAYWDTEIDALENINFKSAGKQPAWINYMTNVNQVRGNFAIEAGTIGTEGGQMYMTLNRRYEQDGVGDIKDLTTYIDPSKYNNIFADTRLDAQNFWTQIGVNIYARRKMSAKLMPNL